MDTFSSSEFLCNDVSHKVMATAPYHTQGGESPLGQFSLLIFVLVDRSLLAITVFYFKEYIIFCSIKY